MTETITELREGDVFRWSYRAPGDDRDYGRYHCCSRIAIVKRGRLVDTFWFGAGSDSRSFGPDDLGRLELKFEGNMADLEKAPEWQADYYDDADIVNLNHSNSTRDNFYLRKGAVRSAEKMLETARKKLDASLADERAAIRRAKDARAAIAKIRAGDTSFYL